jgi:hypothetical protein
MLRCEKRFMTRELSCAYLHGPCFFAAALGTIALFIVDAYFTLDLVSRGAEESNPITAYYLEKSPFTFFTAKYSMPCSAIIIILGVHEITKFGRELRREILFACFILALASVVQWQLSLLYDIE